MSYTFDPLVPRPIDLPTSVPLDVSLDEQALAALDQAKIFAAPDDPAQWAAWRERLEAWRTDARERHGFTGAAYERPQAVDDGLYAAGPKRIQRLAAHLVTL